MDRAHDLRELACLEDELAALEAFGGLTFEELERFDVLEQRRAALEVRLSARAA